MSHPLLTADPKQATNSPFIRSCRLQKNDYTPVWLMRQAGRFMPEYRAIRSKLSFLELCKRPEVASQVTVMAVEQLGVDAGIIFADILLILELLGVGLEFTAQDGPVIQKPIRIAEDVNRLGKSEPDSELSFVYEAIRLTKAALKPTIPLIGFAGAPFTLASYLIEGGSSKHFAKTKTFMHSEPIAWKELMDTLSSLTIKYLNGQIKAGANAIQLFDSWVGCLGIDDYREYVLPFINKIFAGITYDLPMIYFGTGNSALLPFMPETGANVIGFDWRVDLAQEWSKIGYNMAVQGNLDPTLLLSSKEEILVAVTRILTRVNNRPGHIFNLGHGVLPETPVDNVRYLVETVHRLSAS